MLSVVTADVVRSDEQTHAMLPDAAVASMVASVPLIESAREATIDAGPLRGTAEDGVAVYRGIPFAAPPTGDNRWRAPQPVRPWTAVREATRFGHDCMQKPLSSSTSRGRGQPSEDCLYLNVWQPDDAPASEARTDATHQSGHPVIVWFYGGAYVNGSASLPVTDGSAFARDGVVLVSFNYRLGRFGFFAHPALTREQQHESNGAPALGNYAVMDQIAALEWVQRNIAHFGGDPNNVTLVGESAGGNAILNLLASPVTDGLFQRAVVMSGGGRGLREVRHDLSEDTPEYPSAETFGMRFAKRHGVEGENDQALTQLRALPAEAVLGDLNMSMMYTDNRERETYVGGPLRDGRLLIDTTQQRFLHQQQHPVPLVIGTTSMDLSRTRAASKTELFERFGDSAERMRALYDPRGNTNLKTLNREVGRDRTMTEPARFIADEMKAAGAPVWRYRFSHVAAPRRSAWDGAPHATDIPYVFDTLENKYGDRLDDTDHATARAFHQYIVNFIKTGEPNGDGLPQWPQHAHDQQRILDFTQDNGPQPVRDPWWTQLDMLEGSWLPVSGEQRYTLP